MASEEVILPFGAFLDCDCPDPAEQFVPAGYVKGEEGWICGPGYAGTAVKRPEPKLRNEIKTSSKDDLKMICVIYSYVYMLCVMFFLMFIICSLYVILLLCYLFCAL